MVRFSKQTKTMDNIQVEKVQVRPCILKADLDVHIAEIFISLIKYFSNYLTRHRRNLAKQTASLNWRFRFK